MNYCRSHDQFYDDHCVYCGKPVIFVEKVVQTIKGSEIPCLWDNMSETPSGSSTKTGGLSCPCPKCSPTC